jgi:hypothetical protein
MTRLALIIIIIALCGQAFWVGYVCGRDHAQLEYEYQQDVKEGAQK